jgi:predicted enzyme related to lactoylglutathione lyase
MLEVFMPSVTFFSIPIDDSERAREFYRSVFGWKFKLGWEYDTPDGRTAYWDIDPGDGDVAGGMTAREYDGQPIGIGIEVENLDGYLERIERGGGKVIVPKGLIPGRAWFALCQDTEENNFVVYENAS